MTQERIKSLEDVLLHVTAHLLAAISLLERTPKAKKAAPSDTMFNMMLDDYRKSAELGKKVFHNIEN